MSKKPINGKFRLGDDVILHGNVTRLGEDFRGDEVITVTIKGYSHLVTILATDADKAK